METPAAPDLEDVPHELVEAGAAGRLVVLVGAGASLGSGLPSWKGLLNLLLDHARTILPPTRHDELAEAEDWFRTDGEELLKATLLRQMIGEDDLATAIAEALRRSPASPTPIHRALAELPGAAFITTNYDALLEAALAEQTNARPATILLSDIDGLRRFSVGQVLKLHGDINDPKTVVLSSEDYLRTRHTAARVWKERLQKLVKAPSQLLLIGYGYGDIDVLPVLNELRAVLGGELRAPFWVDVNGLRQRARAGTAGLRAVLPASSDGIESWLRELGRAIRQTAHISDGVDAIASDTGSLNWKPRNEPGEIQIAATDKPTVSRFSFQPLNHADALEAYRNGQLAFETLCDITGQHAATWVTDFYGNTATSGSFSPPIPIPSQQSSPLDLRGKQILVGELELLLLQKLGLLSDLLKALADSGQLLVFSDVWWKIRESAAELHKHNEAHPNADAQLAIDVERSIKAGIADGLVDLVERLPIPDLPPPHDTDPNLASISHKWRNLARTLAYCQAIVDRPTRWLLLADYAVTSILEDDPQFVQRLAFRNSEHFMSLWQRLFETSDRVLHLPELVRSLLPETEHRYELLVRLAMLGFPDALESPELIRLTRSFLENEARPHHRSDTSSHELPRVLDGMERIAHEPAHPGAPLARVGIANTFAHTTWDSFRDDIAEREAITGLLLRRAEKIDDATSGNMLEHVIQFAGGFAIRKPKHSFEHTDNAVANLSVASPAGRFWACIADWVGPDGTRHAAYGRAVRWIWMTMEELSGLDGPQSSYQAPMILPIRALRTSLMEPEIQAPATLSAHWAHKPLAFVWPGSTGEERSVERVLEQGAALLSTDPDKIGCDEAQATYPSFDGRIALVPVEAVLLRAAPVAVAEFAHHIAWKQGPHDGRAYDLLQELATHPEDETRHRNYARMTTTAPWRLVREDPTVICTWPQRRMLGESEFPGTTEHLRKMLSEPQGALPANATMFDILRARLADGGAWQTRLDQVELCTQACSVPGVLPAFTLRVRIDLDAVEYAEEVMRALQRLDQPHGESAARLVGDIFFLRVAAARRPYVVLPEGEIDLRERLPERLVTVLRAVSSTPPPETFAQSEAGLLRLCGHVVKKLSLPRGMPFKDSLWLTYRLFQWLVAQFDAMPPDARHAGLLALRKVSPPPARLSPDTNDLLNPFQFENGRLDHRLAAILYAYGVMEELRTQLPDGPNDAKETPRAVTSSALEELLVELATRPLTEEERALRARGDTPSCLDWHGSGAVPDLALKALLQLNSESFFQIPAEARLRWIQDMPRNMDEKERVSWSLASDLIATMTNHAKKLSSQEKTAFEECLRSLDRQDVLAPRAYIWFWLGLTELYSAGALHLETEVQELLLENLSNNAAPTAFGSYLTALSFVAPNRLEAEADRLLAEIEARANEGASIDPVAFAPGLARVIIIGDPASIPIAQSILRRLAQRPPYEGEERMRRLLTMLRLS